MAIFGSSSKKKEAAKKDQNGNGIPRLEVEKSPEANTTSKKTESIQRHSSGKFKGLLKLSNRSSNDSLPLLDKEVEKLSINNKTEDNGLNCNKRRLKKIISTIVEADTDDSLMQNGDSDFSDETDGETDGTSDSYSDSDSEYETEEEEEHLHAIKEKPKSGGQIQVPQLSTIMGYCGMSSLSNTASLAAAATANEESKRTFSLLDKDLKIFRLSCTTKKNDPKLTESVISDEQLKLIEALKAKFKNLHNQHDVDQMYNAVAKGKTLFERYGVVKDVIGKGSYGLIKLIDPDTSDSSNPVCKSRNVLFAVKELQKRPANEKSKDFDSFVDHILSEFIISSSLNYKHVVKTVDLMVILPPRENPQSIRVSQVMEYTSGTDLFSYLTARKDKTNNEIKHVSFEEFDCFIKQIAKGIWYIHNHGVAHCDLKLENILVDYEPSESSRSLKTKINLKLSDFGKSNVFRTKWDHSEQYLPYSNGPLGSEPYIAPEEYNIKRTSGSYSLTKKDFWALGIIALVLFNLRYHYYSNKKSRYVEEEDDGMDVYSPGYLWHSTEPKVSTLKNNEKERRYKDRIFDEYMKTHMIADYDDTTKEWILHREGEFKPFEFLFGCQKLPKRNNRHFNNNDDDEDDFNDLNELRKLTIYKLLDPNPSSRLTVEQLLKGDWMTSVESCV